MCLFVCPSVRPLEGFSWNLTFEYFFFENLLIKFKFHQNLTRITGTLHEHLCTWMIVSLSALFRMRNIPDRIWNVCFMLRISKYFLYSMIFLFLSNHAFYENVEKYCRTVQATVDNIICRMRIVCWITKDTDTHWEYVILIAFSTAKMVARTRLIVTLYVQYIVLTNRGEGLCMFPVRYELKFHIQVEMGSSYDKLIFMLHSLATLPGNHSETTAAQSHRVSLTNHG